MRAGPEVDVTRAITSEANGGTSTRIQPLLRYSARAYEPGDDLENSCIRPFLLRAPLVGVAQKLLGPLVVASTPWPAQHKAPHRPIDSQVTRPFRTSTSVQANMCGRRHCTTQRYSSESPRVRLHTAVMDYR